MEINRFSHMDKERILKQFFDKPKKILLRLFILGMLLDQETHGYEIKKKIEENTLKKWIPSNYLVYGELTDLQKQGLIISREDYKGEVPLKKYNITKDGRKELFNLGIALIGIFDFGNFGIYLDFPKMEERINEWLEWAEKQPQETKLENFKKIERAIEMFLISLKDKIKKNK